MNICYQKALYLNIPTQLYLKNVGRDTYIVSKQIYIYIYTCFFLNIVNLLN